MARGKITPLQGFSRQPDRGRKDHHLHLGPRTFQLFLRFLLDEQRNSTVEAHSSQLHSSKKDRRVAKNPLRLSERARCSRPFRDRLTGLR